MHRARVALAGAMLALVVAAPLSGNAFHGLAVDCTQMKNVDVVCTQEFELQGAVFVSSLETHGNIHIVEPTGAPVTLEWFDADGDLIFTSVCGLTGLSAIGFGPLDAQNVHCENVYETEEGEPLTYTPGTQTLRVTVDPGTFAGDFEYHGRLVFSDGAALI